jgi:transketolase
MTQKGNFFDNLSRELRLDLLDLIYKSGSGHIGGSLASLDILISLYHSDIFNFKKDHFILSAGHLATAFYTVLASKKYFPKSKLPTYGNLGSILQGHISADVPGVEYSSGSLGQGLSFAAGLAIGDPKNTVVCLTSDGEQQEGQIWEAVMFANKYKISNLINIVNSNGYQIDGTTDEIMPLDNLTKKYIQFGWEVISVDGHDIPKLIQTLKQAKKSKKPICVIANTTLGKGISFMECNIDYHDVKDLSKENYLLAKNELQNYLS